MTLSRRQLLTGLSATAASIAFSPGLRGSQQPAASAPAARRILDLHHHFGSPRWIKRMAESQRQGWQGFQEYTPARAIETMDEGGTQTAFISCTEPGVWFGDDFERERQDAILLSRDMNEYGARMVSDYKGRFGLFAVLPLPDIDASLKEIEYAFDTLKADGVGVLTSYGNMWLGDVRLQPVLSRSLIPTTKRLRSATTMQPLNVPSLNARELQALVAIAHFGSLIGAAAFLQTSQSALSRMVTRIEKLVGVRLFTRSTRRIELTPAGREFVAVSERVLNDLRIALGGLRDVAAEQRGQVIVSALPIVVHHTLPQLVRTFCEQRPLVDLQIRAGYSAAVIEDVVGGLADFGIVAGDVVLSAVERIALRRESLYVIVPRDHALAETSAPVRLAQLRNVPLVSPPRDSQTRLQIEGAAAAAGIHLRHAVLVPGFPEIIEYVRAGVGIGFVPAGALPQPLPDEVIARLLSAPALSIVISMIRLVGRHMSPAADAFWELVLKQLRSEPRASAARPQRASGARSRRPTRPHALRRSQRSRLTG